MDLEFHYYITFLVAAHAGFSYSDAYRIAYSAQYVDDNTTAIQVRYPNSFNIYCNDESTISSPFPTTEALQTLLCFHFLPGDNLNRYIVSPGSTLACTLLLQALETNNSHLIGIASHAFADTWAHQGFVGAYHEQNTVDDWIGENIIPNLGHLHFGVVPDCVGVRWYDSRADMTIDNNTRFKEAAMAMFDLYVSITKLPAVKQARVKLSLSLLKLLDRSRKYFLLRHEIDRRLRVRKYIKAALQNCGYQLPTYNHRSWFDDALEYKNLAYFWKHEAYQNSDWYKFQEAVKNWKYMAWQGVKSHLDYPKGLLNLAKTEPAKEV